MTTGTGSGNPRYEPHERPPLWNAIALGVQGGVVSVPSVVVYPTIVGQVAGASVELTAWIVFVTLAATGITAILQTMSFGRVGSGHHLAAIPLPIAIPFCALALATGGPKTLAALVLCSGLFALAITLRLSLLRRVFTPTVIGSVNILIVITVWSVVMSKIDSLPAGTATGVGPACAAVTLAATLACVLPGPGFWRTWGPTFGLGLGGATALAFGVIDPEPIRHAFWVGVPFEGRGGFGFDFGPAFWPLLPAFLFIAVLSVVQTNSLAFVSQRVSRRAPRAIDFRAVQGGVFGAGLGNVLSGLGGGMPVAASARGGAFVQQTGCASRDVGLIVGATFLALAFIPKAWALLLVIPTPVMAGYLIVILGPLLVEGLKAIVQDDPDYSKSLVVATSLAVGLAFQFEMIDLPIPDLWETTLQNAVASGGITVIVLTTILELAGSRRRRLQVTLDTEELPRINEFLADFARRRSWNERMTTRMQVVAEETLLALLDRHDAGRQRRLRLVAIGSRRGAELEFVTAPTDAGNLEDHIRLLTDSPAAVEETPSDGEVSLRMLRHFSSSVSHRQYHETDIITVHVAPVR